MKIRCECMDGDNPNDLDRKFYRICSDQLMRSGAEKEMCLMWCNWDKTVLLFGLPIHGY